jgi:histone H3/H4
MSDVDETEMPGDSNEDPGEHDYPEDYGDLQQVHENELQDDSLNEGLNLLVDDDGFSQTNPLDKMDINEGKLMYSVVDEVGAEDRTVNDTEGTTIKKPLTAYFLYLADHRAKAQKEAGGSVAGVTKMLGAQWKALSEEEKKVYSDRAKEQKAAYLKRMSEMGHTKTESASKKRKSNAQAADDNELGGIAELKLDLPLARVKRVMMMDEDVTSSSKQSVLLVALATERFVAEIATDMFEIATRSKRKTLKTGDLLTIIRRKRHLEFLRGDFVYATNMKKKEERETDREI